MDEFDSDEIEMEEREEKGFDRVVSFRPKRKEAERVPSGCADFSGCGSALYGILVVGLILFVAAAVLKWAWGVLFGG